MLAISSLAKADAYIGHPQHNTYIKEWIGGLANCITDANPASTVTADNQAPPWVVKEPQLLEWLNGAPSAVLWVTGKPGESSQLQHL